MRPNIAVIGCGAVARTLYLPVLATHRATLGGVWLVDPSQRARAAASSIVDGKAASDLANVDGKIDAAIIATGNSLHYGLARDALARGADVLLEKPFVIWPDEGRMLVDAAAAADRLLAVNQTRRFFPVAQELRSRIQAGEFGALRSIVHNEGAKLAWPYESGAAFAQGAERTGVLMDIGVHVVDFYHYLLRPTWTFVSAVHDGFDGPEGLVDLELRANGAPVSIRLSRYQQQENVARLVFERAEISLNVYELRSYSIRSTTLKNGSVSAAGGVGDYKRLGEPLLENFFAARDKREPVICDGESSLPVIGILDEAYRRARRYAVALGTV